MEAVETVETVGNADGVQEQAAAEPAYEDLQARIAELEAQLKDEQLRALANEQNLRRRHQQELRIRTSSPDRSLPWKCCRSRIIWKWRFWIRAAISMR
ncbi:hypothetical protein BN1095_4150001 [Clostridioides difficile]|uniref:Uncharacterized protein n=1 Tax=Clostridioides difficile TaxID=1496 RepID=A0A069AWK3_CLODI|nr:hypothetical protein BN1095_4150001 [Clostridioides difficile]